MVARLRGFETATEHDRALFRNFKKQVGEYDTVYWLGDIAFNGWKERMVMIRSRMPFVEHHLILGNHDRAHPINSRGHVYTKEFFSVFDSVSLFGRISYGGAGALLSHFPYTGDHGPDRYNQYRLRDEGKPIFHGHTHSDQKLSLSTNGTLQVHVGLDAWELKPVSLFDAFSLLK